MNIQNPSNTIYFDPQLSNEAFLITHLLGTNISCIFLISCIKITFASQHVRPIMSSPKHLFLLGNISVFNVTYLLTLLIYHESKTETPYSSSHLHQMLTNFTANFLNSAPVKNFFKALNIWCRYGQEYGFFLFMTHSVDRIYLW